MVAFNNSSRDACPSRKHTTRVASIRTKTCSPSAIKAISIATLMRLRGTITALRPFTVLQLTNSRINNLISATEDTSKQTTMAAGAKKTPPIAENME